MQGLRGLRLPSECMNLSFSPLSCSGSINTTYPIALHVPVRPVRAIRWKTRWLLKAGIDTQDSPIPNSSNQGLLSPINGSMGQFQPLLPSSGLVSSSSGSVWPRANTAGLHRAIAWNTPCRARRAQKPGQHRMRRGNEQPLWSELIKHFNLLSWGLTVLWWLSRAGYQKSWGLFLVYFSNEKETVLRQATEAQRRLIRSN